MELSKYKGTYRGWDRDIINYLESFLDNLPIADVIDDKFHDYMKERKKKALGVFQKYLKIKEIEDLERENEQTPSSCDFDWNQPKFNTLNQNIQEKLRAIISPNINNKYPFGVFISSNSRCSDFKFKGSKYDQIRNWEEYYELIELTGIREKITFNSPLGKSLSVLVRLKDNPSHYELLPEILNTHPNSIIIEAFIWMPIKSVNPKLPAFVTGTIDALLVSNNTIIIADYKPEANLIRSLPQVAAYGLILKSMLKYPNIYCISFNSNMSIQFKPEILFDLDPLTNAILEDHPDFNPQWVNIFHKN